MQEMGPGAGQGAPAAAGELSTGKLQWAQLQSTGSSKIMSWWPRTNLQLQEHLWEGRKTWYTPIVLPPAAYQTVSLHFSHCSACRNVFLNERGRHCNDNQGQTKLVWKFMSDFLPSLSFCHAAHLTFWCVAEVKLSPPLHYFLHQGCCEAKLGLSSGTATMPQGNEGSTGKVLLNSGNKRAHCAFQVRTAALTQIPEERNILPIKHHDVLVERGRKCSHTMLIRAVLWL